MMECSTINTLDTPTRLTVLEHEVLTLGNLITRREAWIDNPKNKRLGTYTAVVKDTAEMKDKLEDLKLQIIEINSKYK
jgi:hypothetical protein